jgi:hypothetical protein
LVALKPAAGDHVYVVAPLAVKFTLFPEQMVADTGATVTVGVGFTVILIVFVLAQVPTVPVTVYVVVTAGFAVTVAPVDALKPVLGLHT